MEEMIYVLIVWKLHKHMLNDPESISMAEDLFQQLGKSIYFLKSDLFKEFGRFQLLSKY